MDPGVIAPLLHGRVLPTTLKVGRARLNRGKWELLAHWMGRPATEASWECLDQFSASYPDFQLEDELFI